MLKFFGILFIILVIVILAISFEKFRKFIIIGGIIFLIVSFYQSFPNFWRSINSGHKIEELTMEKDELNSQLQELTSQSEELTAENEDLNSQLQELTKENESLKVQLESASHLSDKSVKTVLDLIFKPDGNTYIPEEGFRFYSDTLCGTEITDIHFSSREHLYLELDNGNKVYASLSDKGFVFSTTEPKFREVSSD